MRIDRAELFHVRLPLVRGFETSFGRVDEQDTVIVRLDCGDLCGWGEAPAQANPFYSYETAETVTHILRDFLCPMLVGQEFSHPSDLPVLLGKVRGHPMAHAALEAAAWDILAQQESQSIASLLGAERDNIEVGISLGLEPTEETLLAKVEQALAEGYRRIKVKIGPGRDRSVLTSVRKHHPDIRLWADANGAYTLGDTTHLKSLAEFDLEMLEQPLNHEDIVDHATLAREIDVPICLDESITSLARAREALELNACRIINVKPPRVGGLTIARAIHDLAAGHGIPVWCGGLLETGIGRLHNISIASLPNFQLPGDLSASARYYAEDLIDPPVEVDSEGKTAVPDSAGIAPRVAVDRVKAYATVNFVVETQR